MPRWRLLSPELKTTFFTRYPVHPRFWTGFSILIRPLHAVKSVELAFDWRQQSLAYDCQFCRTNEVYGRPDCSLLIPFSVWIISLACAITNLLASSALLERRCINQFVSCPDVLILHLNFTRTWLWVVCVEVPSLWGIFICKFKLFVCAVLSHLPCDKVAGLQVQVTANKWNESR